MIETFLPLARALVDAMAPLRDVIEDPSGHRFQVLIHELGWDVEAGSWFSGFTLITALTPVVERATSLAATLEREGTEVGTAVGEAAELTITVADAISAIASTMRAALSATISAGSSLMRPAIGSSTSASSLPSETTITPPPTSLSRLAAMAMSSRLVPTTIM